MTVTSNVGILRELRSECHIAPAFDPTSPPSNAASLFKKFVAVWDTGATNSVISPAVVAKLGLKPVSLKQVHTANGVATCEAFLVNLGLPNGVAFGGLEVTVAPLHGTDALIGMDVISSGDFAITHKDGQTKFTYGVPPRVSIDFVHEFNTNAAAGSGHPRSKKKRKGRRR